MLGIISQTEFGLKKKRREVKDQNNLCEAKTVGQLFRHCSGEHFLLWEMSERSGALPENLLSTVLLLRSTRYSLGRTLR